MYKKDNGNENPAASHHSCILVWHHTNSRSTRRILCSSIRTISVGLKITNTIHIILVDLAAAHWALVYPSDIEVCSLCRPQWEKNQAPVRAPLDIQSRAWRQAHCRVYGRHEPRPGRRSLER